MLVTILRLKRWVIKEGLSVVIAGTFFFFNTCHFAFANHSHHFPIHLTVLLVQVAQVLLSLEKRALRLGQSLSTGVLLICQVHSTYDIHEVLRLLLPAFICAIMAALHLQKTYARHNTSFSALLDKTCGVHFELNGVSRGLLDILMIN